MTRPVLAVDIGGTKLAAALVDGDGGLVVRAKNPTPATTDAEVLWQALLGVVDEVLHDGLDIDAVGIGCGGPMKLEAGLVSPLNIVAWRDFPLRDRMREHVGGVVPVVLRNDAVAMAIGEYAHGAGAGSRSLLGVVVSTGVGGGLVVDGAPLAGATGNAGHVGHIVVDPDGPHCVCGGRGCLEAIARGPAVVDWALAEGWQPESPADGVALVASAREGHPVALAALTRAGRALGIACASAAALLELEVIAVGGGLANAGDLLLSPALAAFDRYAGLDFVRRCRLELAALGGDAGLVGAGVLARAAIRGGTDWTA
jgi:glucokinase